MTDFAWDPLIWVALALLLMAGEAVIPGFLLLGFGIGALFAAAAVGFAAEPIQAMPQPVSALVTLWFGLSLLAWGLLWLIWGRRAPRRGGDDVNDFRNSR